MKTEAPSTLPEIQTLKTGTCSSLSGKSKLTYHVGCNAKDEVLLRVYANTGKGCFSQEWVGLDAVLKTFEKAPVITCFTLHPLYSGKSINSPGFLLAALKAEGLVQQKEGARTYERIDPAKIMEGVKALLASKGEAKPEGKPKPSRKPAVKAEEKPA